MSCSRTFSTSTQYSLLSIEQASRSDNEVYIYGRILVEYIVTVANPILSPPLPIATVHRLFLLKILASLVASDELSRAHAQPLPCIIARIIS